MSRRHKRKEQLPPQKCLYGHLLTGRSIHCSLCEARGRCFICLYAEMKARLTREKVDHPAASPLKAPKRKPEARVRREQYEAYLTSPEWAVKREQAFDAHGRACLAPVSRVVRRLGYMSTIGRMSASATRMCERISDLSAISAIRALTSSSATRRSRFRQLPTSTSPFVGPSRAYSNKYWADGSPEHMNPLARCIGLTRAGWKTVGGNHVHGLLES